MPIPALRLLSASAVVALILLACGGDDNNGAATDPDAGGGNDDGGNGTDTSTTGVTVMTPPAPSAGCGAANVAKGFTMNQSITVSGVKRTYGVFVPDTYDSKKTFPLVFVLHGDGGTGAGIRGSFTALETEAAGNAIFVYPDGLNQTWIIDPAAGLLADAGFIDALAADLGKTHCTDNTRLFAVGFSKGAYFANMLACISKTPWRAVVAHSGGGPFYLDGIGTTYDTKANDVVCPAKAPATMQIIGDADSLLSDGQKARDHWIRTNTCKTTTTAFAPSPCVAYDGCAADHPEVYCEIPGMGHEVWSSAAPAIWNFLKTK
jgi:polyhydroxybutyrate depolymerase